MQEWRQNSLYSIMVSTCIWNKERIRNEDKAVDISQKLKQNLLLILVVSRQIKGKFLS